MNTIYIVSGARTSAVTPSLTAMGGAGAVFALIWANHTLWVGLALCDFLAFATWASMVALVGHRYMLTNGFQTLDTVLPPETIGPALRFAENPPLPFDEMMQAVKGYKLAKAMKYNGKAQKDAIHAPTPPPVQAPPRRPNV